MRRFLAEWWGAVAITVVVALVFFVMAFAPVVETDSFRGEDGSLFVVACDKTGWFQPRVCVVFDG